MAKVLFVANIFSHFLAFHIPYIKMLTEMGHEVHVAAGGEVVNIPYTMKQFYIPIQRVIFNPKNIIAYKNLKSIIEIENYDMVHCHTAMGGAIARLSAKVQRKRKKCIVAYTAHGFHFYKGGPVSRWLIHYPLERYLARLSDAIITINKEDYNRITQWNISGLRKYLIPGIGLNTHNLIRSNSRIRHELRNEYGYSDNDFILIYVGRLTSDKNQIYFLEKAKMLKQNISNLKILFAGDGPKHDKLAHCIEVNKLESFVTLLGFRKDVAKLIALSDVGISSCKNEGFGINILEEMWSGLPVVASNNRGHNETIRDGINGYIFNLNKNNIFEKRIHDLYVNSNLREQLGNQGMVDSEKFTIESVVGNMRKIYNELLELK